MKKAVYLKKVPLFAEIKGGDMRRLAKIGGVQTYSEGEKIFDENTSGDRLYIVLSGQVKIFTSSGQKKKTLAYLEKGEFFGEMSLIDMELRSASSTATKDSELFMIKKKDFKHLIARYPSISLQIMKTLSKRLRQADKEIESLTYGDVLGRVAKLLIDFSKKYGESTDSGQRIKMSLPHREIAEIAGTGREVVTRILNRFRKMHCITCDKKYLTIIDQTKLGQFAR
ncbi:MAG: Crp/Fnr family transcriptional regulator [Endomicrobiales bacterium]|nr:Crp/Fnr family transcriptional regulator [Endomicrobiales bacterium]